MNHLSLKRMRNEHNEHNASLLTAQRINFQNLLLSLFTSLIFYSYLLNIMTRSLLEVFIHIFEQH